MYILQRWSEKWIFFVDVTDVDQVVDGDGDRLTITMQSSPKLKGAESADNGEPGTSTTSEFDRVVRSAYKATPNKFPVSRPPPASGYCEP